MTMLLLACEFFKTGLFAVGGGMATLPFLMEMTEKYDWFSMEELMNMIAIGESTPGPIGVNMATYAGYNVAGIPGALVATLSLVLPSFLIILIISGFLQRFRSSRYVEGAFCGIRPAVTALLLVVVLQLLENILFVKGNQERFLSSLVSGNFTFQWIPLAIILSTFICLQLPKVKKIHPVLWILIGALLGIVLKL